MSTQWTSADRRACGSASLDSSRAGGGSPITNRDGLALVATILVLGLVAVLSTAALSGALSSLRIAGSDHEESRVFYGAEAGGEVAMAQLHVALKDGLLTDDELANVRPPSIAGLSYDSFAVERDGGSYVETLTDGPFAGLYALTQNVDIYSRAEDVNGALSGVVLRAKAQAIPIFQFGVFFEEDLEATNGPPMEFVGRVHSNGNIYLSSDNAWYREIITTPNEIYHDRKDHHSVRNGVWVNDAGGDEIQLDFDSRSHPDPEAFKQKSCDDFDCRVQTSAFDVDSLNLPLPPGVPPYELARPREDTDGESEREIKFAWNADMYVTLDFNEMVTRGDVCGSESSEPSEWPDEVIGNVTVRALQPVEPGRNITFKLADACGGFDGAGITIRVDGLIVDSFDMMGSCTFTFTVPDDANTLEIIIDDAEWSGGTMGNAVQNGSAIWDDLQSLGAVDDEPWPEISVERTGTLEAPDQDALCDILDWRWSAFYDGREEELKDVLDLDMAAVAAWVGTDDNRRTEVIYFEWVAPDGFGDFGIDARSRMPDGAFNPAVRVVSGVVLPNKLTVASEWPLYVRGDYNTIDKQPSALVGDGITILSNSWSDGQNRPDDGTFQDCEGQGVSPANPCDDYLDWADAWWNRDASETTVNGAILAGHTPTPCDHEEPGCFADGSQASCYGDCYGGGIENFPRFLEDWGGIELHYTGALISPFTSQKTTGTWNGSYYSPPVRDWAFDTDFRNPELLPPGTPNVGVVIRTAMREAY